MRKFVKVDVQRFGRRERASSVLYAHRRYWLVQTVRIRKRTCLKKCLRCDVLAADDISVSDRVQGESASHSENMSGNRTKKGIFLDVLKLRLAGPVLLLKRWNMTVGGLTAVQPMWRVSTLLAG